MKVGMKCDWCSKSVWKYPSKVKQHNFCSKECLACFSNKGKNPDGYAKLKDLSAVSSHMRLLNHELNPKRMTMETRQKLRKSRLGKGEGKNYGKLYGKAEHRMVAERILGRPLDDREVVHHLDFNKRNNAPWNLMIFPSQKEHARYHATLSRFFDTGESAAYRIEEVMPNEVHSS